MCKISCIFYDNLFNGLNSIYGYCYMAVNGAGDNCTAISKHFIADHYTMSGMQYVNHADVGISTLSYDVVINVPNGFGLS